MAYRATGVGSMPGEDYAETMQIVLGEVGDLPFVAELPDRGVAAGMVGRTLGMISGLGADLQPSGWRLTDAAGVDQRRARSLLAQDLDTVEELVAAHGDSGVVKVQLAGPWTLAAAVERPRGDLVLADHGARRDLAQALADAVREHVTAVRRRVGTGSVVVQLDEPALPAVLAGAVATASGFSRHRSVSPAAAAQAIDWLVEAVTSCDATCVVHCCAADVPFGLLRDTAVQAVSFDLSQVTRPQYGDLAAWVDAGRELWPGVVPATEPDSEPPTETDVTRRLLSWWTALGFSDPDTVPAATVTPTCGLAGATSAWAREALTLAARVARTMSAESA